MNFFWLGHRLSHRGRKTLWSVAAVCLIHSVAVLYPQSSGNSADEPQTLIRAQAEAVILDLVVRDKDGRAVEDLSVDEIEVYEDGVKQRIVSFRSREEIVSIEASQVKERAQEEAPPELKEERPGPSQDRSRQRNLVTLVFDRLSLDSRRFARQGATDFLETGLPENALVSVFSIGHRLHVVQPFTSDRNLVREAIQVATSGRDSILSAQSSQIQEALEQSVSIQASSGGTPSFGRGNTPTGDFGAGLGEGATAQLTLNMLQRFQQLAREQQGIASIYSLLSLVTEQGNLAGRKTLLYFSEGLQVPASLVERFRFTISEANKANVSVYAVDARGLNSTAQTEAARQMLERAARIGRRQVSEIGAVTREQAMLMNSVEDSIRMNAQETLATLSESTGGFLIANTNDIRPAVRDLKEDLEVYYEIAYTPQNLEYDGSFRQIRVEINRPDIIVRTRNGYFAIPPSSDGSTVFPYEVHLLAALNSNPLPSNFEYRNKALRFRPEEEGQTHYSLVMEVPLDAFTFVINEETQTYTTRFSLMALVKDMSGRVIQKISQDYPLEGPQSRVEELRKTEILFIRHFHLTPGRYRLETAAFDHHTGRRSAKRSYLFVPEPTGELMLSQLSVIRRIDPVAEEKIDEHNPFLVEAGKIIPDLSGSVGKTEGSQISFFFVVYPARRDVSPQLYFQLLKDGQVTGQAQLDLPTARSDGSIPYVASLPTDALEPGRYEVRAIAQQGSSQAAEEAFFDVVSREE